MTNDQPVEARPQQAPPVAPRPAGRFKRGWRWCREHPLAVVLLVLVAWPAGMLLYPRLSRPEPPRYRVSVRVVWSAPLVNGKKNNPPGSPRVADLNGDGVKDVVIGGGDEGSGGYLLALDGTNGKPLWRCEADDEVVPATPFLDVNRDGTPDVFVNGRKLIRSPFAVDGGSGKAIWRLQEANPQTSFEPIQFLHVFPVNDSDGDGLIDLLLIQSGGADELRIPARYHLVSAATGKIIRTHLLPDRRESYALPVLEERRDGSSMLFAGSGGETLPGHLLKLRLDTMEEVWRVGAQRPSATNPPAPGRGATPGGKGFIASPVLADLEGDGRREIIAVGMDGRVYRVDANSGKVAWVKGNREDEAYASPAVGQFDEEGSLDVVAAFNRGVFPHYDQTKLVWRNGWTGEPIHAKEYSHYVYTASSPLVVDFNNDGRDEVVAVLSSNYRENNNELFIFDGGEGKQTVLAKRFPGFSGSTPCLSDVDGNGKLDLIHAYATACVRLELTVEVETPQGAVEVFPTVKWGEYRGPNGSGVYLPKE